MKKEQWAFLLGGFAFGVLAGYGLFHAVDARPFASAAASAAGIPAPSGPAAPTQTAGGAAPMVQEINALKERIQQSPDDLQATLRLGDLYRQVGMWEQADPLFERALELAPQNSELVRNLAYLYHDNGRWQRAIELYERALSTAPEDPDLLTDMGICYKELQQYQKAIALFERAQRANPSHWQSLYNIAVVRGLDLGEFDRADAAIARLREVRPGAQDVESLHQAIQRRRAESATSGG